MLYQFKSRYVSARYASAAINPIPVLYSISIWIRNTGVYQFRSGTPMYTHPDPDYLMELEELAVSSVNVPLIVPYPNIHLGEERTEL